MRYLLLSLACLFAMISTMNRNEMMSTKEKTEFHELKCNLQLHKLNEIIKDHPAYKKDYPETRIEPKSKTEFHELEGKLDKLQNYPEKRTLTELKTEFHELACKLRKLSETIKDLPVNSEKRKKAETEFHKLVYKLHQLDKIIIERYDERWFQVNFDGYKRAIKVVTAP